MNVCMKTSVTEKSGVVSDFSNRYTCDDGEWCGDVTGLYGDPVVDEFDVFSIPEQLLRWAHHNNITPGRDDEIMFVVQLHETRIEERENTDGEYRVDECSGLRDDTDSYGRGNAVSIGEFTAGVCPRGVVEEFNGAAWVDGELCIDPVVFLDGVEDVESAGEEVPVRDEVLFNRSSVRVVTTSECVDERVLDAVAETAFLP